MKNRRHEGIALVCVVSLAVASCTVGTAPPPDGAEKVRKQGPSNSSEKGGPPIRPGSRPVSAVSPDDPSTGRELLRRLIDFLGGEQTIDGVRGLELRSHVERVVAGGKTQTDEITTWIQFPGKYRQKLTLPAGELVTIVSPEGSFFVTSQGSISLPDAQRTDIERSVMRNLVALVKTRRNELFLVSGSRGERFEGRTADRLIVRVADETTTIWIEPETGKPLREEYESLNSAGERLPKVTLDLADYRRIGGLVYPFATSATVNGTPAYSARLEALVVNGPMDDALFRPPPAIGPPSR